MLHQAEESSLQEWVPHGLPESCERDIQQHQETYQSIQSVKESIDELKIEGERLKEQGNELDCQMIDRWISDLIQRWEECMTASEEKQVHTLYSTAYIPHYTVYSYYWLMLKERLRNLKHVLLNYKMNYSSWRGEGKEIYYQKPVL